MYTVRPPYNHLIGSVKNGDYIELWLYKGQYINENDVRDKGGPKDSCCALVKVKGEFDVKERDTLKALIKDKFNIEDSRMIFVKIPILESEQANVTILVNTKAIGPKILEIASEAEASWDAYKEEYGKWGLTTEEFKQSLMDVVHQFS